MDPNIGRIAVQLEIMNRELKTQSDNSETVKALAEAVKQIAVAIEDQNKLTKKMLDMIDSMTTYACNGSSYLCIKKY